jgi:hypothetical protein
VWVEGGQKMALLEMLTEDLLSKQTDHDPPIQKACLQMKPLVTYFRGRVHTHLPPLPE